MNVVVSDGTGAARCSLLQWVGVSSEVSRGGRKRRDVVESCSLSPANRRSSVRQVQWKPKEDTVPNPYLIGIRQVPLA